MKGGTELGRVRGLGSAKHGTHHWWDQRLTSGANLLLMAWFMISLARLPGYDFATITTWAGSAWNAIPLILLTVSVVWHMRLGLQVVIEDYQHDESRVVLMILLNFYAIAIATLAIFAILRLAFTGHA